MLLDLSRVYQPDYLDLTGSVEASSERTAAVIARYQAEAGWAGSDLVDAVERYYDLSESERSALLVPEAFAGVTQGSNAEIAGGGIALEARVERSAGVMKQAVSSGLAAPAVLQAGRAFVANVATTAVHDTARNVTWSRANTTKILNTYVRAVQPGACSRCIILAGKSTGNITFRRHPMCRCYAIPAPENDDGAIATDPQEFFDALSPEEQDRRFTKAGAEAIRQGADIGRVVNARAGAEGIKYSRHGNPVHKFLDDYGHPRTGRRLQPRVIGTRPDGTPLTVYSTTELTGRKGRRAYKYREGIRLMPEQIHKMAGGNTTRYRALLAEYGYIL